MKTQNSRRNFLRNVTATAAVAPFIFPLNAWSAPLAPEGKIKMGFIGMGVQAKGLLKNFMNHEQVHVLAVCDVDTTRRNAAKARVDEFYKNSECQAYADFREIIKRKDIDAVCIATPDHWHAVTTLAALRAGKDVYCEKPLTHNIHEAVEVIKAVEKNKRVLQTGSMQRSSKEFRVAAELVQNGIIGKIHHVDCSFGGPGIPCELKEDTMEPGLDWDMWCGPGPKRPYSEVLSPRGVHDFFPNWRLFKEYGGGMVCDWGAHHLDIAQWGLGMDNSGPVEVIPPTDLTAKNGAKLVYANGIYVQHVNGFGVHFFGSKGEVKVNRGRIVVILDGKTVAEWNPDNNKSKDPAAPKPTTTLAAELEKLENAYLKNAKIKLYDSTNHFDDFLACVVSRKKPITSEIVGGHTAICCHLLNQSYYNHAHIKWDPAKYKFTGGTGDQKWLTRDYRSPWMV